MKKRTRYIVISVVVLVALAVVAKTAGWIGKPARIQVTVEKVSRRTITETVSANGEIQPEVEVKISADVSGEIVELHVKEGQKVNKGDHLLTINPDLIKAAADRMAAALNQAKAMLANAKAREEQIKAGFVFTEASFNRSQKLYGQKVISEAEFENARNQYEAAKADLEAARQNTLASQYSVKSAEASLKEATDNLGRTRIYAPTEGTVSKLNVEKGERVVGTAQMTGTELLRIANLNEMEVNAQVNENDIVRVHLTDTALIEVEAYSGRKFKGIVTEIARSSVLAGVTGSTATASAGEKVVNFQVKIRILRESYADLTDPNRPDDSPFFPGMNATVDIQTRQEKDVPGLPIMAVTVRPASEVAAAQADSASGGIAAPSQDMKEVVFVYENGKVKLVEIETGIQDNQFIQVKKGLSEGQEVVSAPYAAVSRILRNGMQVEKVEAGQLNYTPAE